MKNLRFWGIMLLTLALILGLAGNFAYADLLTSQSQVISLHGKVETGGIINSFNQVLADGTETPFTIPEGTNLMVTSVSARYYVKGKYTPLRLKLVNPNVPAEVPGGTFAAFGVEGIYSGGYTKGGNNYTGVYPGIRIGTNFAAVLMDLTEKTVITKSLLGVRIIGYLVDVPVNN
jgi:hypothetical protein